MAKRRRKSWRFLRTRPGEPFSHGFNFTLGGAAYVAICVFVGLAAANSQINLLFLVLGIVLGGLLISGGLSTFALTGVSARRRMPASAVAGRPVTIHYELTNRKRWLASYSLHVGEHRGPLQTSSCYLPAVPPRTTRTQRATVLCPRRGVFRFEALNVFTRFPFSLFVHYARMRDESELVVFPAIGRLATDALSTVMQTGGGVRRVRYRRGLEEFYGLREYRPGDNPRWIHWRRSARLGTLQVREMAPPVPRRLVLLISAARPDGGGASADDGPPDELLELALSLAASLISDAMAQAYEVGLLVTEPVAEQPPRPGSAATARRRPAAAPPQPGRWFPPTRSFHQRSDMMWALAALAGRTATPLDALPRTWLRQLAGAQCIWISRGLSEAEVARQVDALAALHLAVEPMRAEQTPFDRLLVLPESEPSNPKSEIQNPR